MNMAVLERDLATEPGTSFQGAAVRLRGVTKAFGGHQVLRGIDLDI